MHFQAAQLCINERMFSEPKCSAGRTLRSLPGHSLPGQEPPMNHVLVPVAAAPRGGSSCKGRVGVVHGGRQRSGTPAGRGGQGAGGSSPCKGEMDVASWRGSLQGPEPCHHFTWPPGSGSSPSCTCLHATDFILNRGLAPETVPYGSELPVGGLGRELTDMTQSAGWGRNVRRRDHKQPD